MHPDIRINYLAVGAGVVANFFLGFVWYGPLFGKVWARLMGFPPDFKPKGPEIARAMVMTVVGAFLTAYVMAHTVAIWRPSSWNAGADQPAWNYGFFSAFFTWLGFFVPVLLGSVAWEGKSWKLFFINAGYHFVSLQVIGAILAHWR